MKIFKFTLKSSHDEQRMLKLINLIAALESFDIYCADCLPTTKKEFKLIHKK